MPKASHSGLYGDRTRSSAAKKGPAHEPRRHARVDRPIRHARIVTSYTRIPAECPSQPRRALGWSRCEELPTALPGVVSRTARLAGGVIALPPANPLREELIDSGFRQIDAALASDLFRPSSPTPASLSSCSPDAPASSRRSADPRTQPVIQRRLVWSHTVFMNPHRGHELDAMTSRMIVALVTVPSGIRRRDACNGAQDARHRGPPPGHLMCAARLARWCPRF